MSELDDELDAIERLAVLRLFLEQQVIWGCGHFSVDSEVVLELSGEKAGGIQVAPDQTISGRFTNPKLAEMYVADATHEQQLIGRTIILAANVNLMVPYVGPQLTTLAHCLKPYATMAYYHPEDIPADSKYGLPTSFRQIAGSYARMFVDGVECFDVR